MFLANPYVTVPGSNMERRIKRSLHHNAIQCFSIDFLSFGIVQVEAMSCGKPVVATLIPASGVSWVNRDGFSGINVKPRDPEALAEGILEAVRNSAQWGKGASQLFQERYTLSSMINKTIKLYETLTKL